MRRLCAVLLAGLAAACGGATATSLPPVPVVGPATGPLGVWTELPWQGVDPTLVSGSVQLQPMGDTMYLLIGHRLYRSDDHGAQFALRPRTYLDTLAAFGGRLLGWSDNQEAPMFASDDGGLSWHGRAVETYSGDQIMQTGATASPVLFRSLGSVAVMVRPGQSALEVSSSPPGGWQPTIFRPSAAFASYAKDHGEAIDVTPMDAARVGDSLYACTHAGVFRSVDQGQTWDQLPPPDGQVRSNDGCWLTRFQTVLCAAVTHWAGAKLYCTHDGTQWQAAGPGLYNEVPGNPQWAAWVGMAYVLDSAEVGGRFYLANRGDNPYAKSEGGLYEASDVAGPWTRLPALAGQTFAALGVTSQALLVASYPAGWKGVPATRLRLWRYRLR